MVEERSATQEGRCVVTASSEAESALAVLASLPDKEIDPAAAALNLSALGGRITNSDPYHQHLSEISSAVQEACADSLGNRVEALNNVICCTFGYHGDTETYDDLDNADLARVIDRRKGLPVTLGILYLHAARAQGWGAEGLGFPCHFLIRVEGDGDAQVVDPFHAGRVLDADGMRMLLKTMMGPDAELEPTYWQPVQNREVLIRLQNNIKTRCLERGDVARALRTVEATLLFAPETHYLWRDAGVLNAKLGYLGAAAHALECYLAHGIAGAARDDAEQLLSRVRAGLN